MGQARGGMGFSCTQRGEPHASRLAPGLGWYKDSQGQVLGFQGMWNSEHCPRRPPGHLPLAVSAQWALARPRMLPWTQHHGSSARSSQNQTYPACPPGCTWLGRISAKPWLLQPNSQNYLSGPRKSDRYLETPKKLQRKSRSLREVYKAHLQKLR